MPVNPPSTAVRTSHAVTIRVKGVVVGMINQWAPAQSRTITPIYELNAQTSGEPTEKVPGNVTGQTVGIQRYDLYPARMEQVFGYVDLNMLSMQNAGIQVLEKWQYPDGTTETVQYDGCWFSTIGRTYRSDGDRLVNVNATLEYTKRTFIPT